MSTAINAACETLVDFLENELRSEISFFNNGTMVVSLNNPQEMMVRDNQEGVSVWPYCILRDADRLNDPPIRLDINRQKKTPFPAVLKFLITAVGEDQPPETEHHIIGTIIRALHDHPRFQGTDLRGSFQDTDIVLNVRFDPLTLEEMTRIWDALKPGLSFQLCIAYEMSLVLVDSREEERTFAPVETINPEVGLIVDRN